MKFNKNLQHVTPALTLQLVAKVNELRKKNIDIVSFTVGEPDFPTPEAIKNAGIQAIRENYTKYTASIGIPELKKAVVEKLKRENNLDYKPEQIAISNGAKHSISNVVYAVLNPGDEVIIPSPFWLSYADMVSLCGAKSVLIETSKENGYKLTAKQLQQKITPKTKLLFLNSPNNPTGAVYSKEELQSLVPVIKSSGIWVISDEIYEKLVYGNAKFESFAQFTEVKDQVILINGVSKAFSMTGWRIGYTAACSEIIEAVDKVQSHFTSSPCSISQKAALAALTSNVPEVEEMRKAFEKRRNLGLELMKQIPDLSVYPSEGAFYLFPQCDGYYGRSFNGRVIKDSLTLSSYFLEECHVAVVPGVAFGEDRNFRISYATSESEIEKGIKRIHQGLQRLKK